MITNRKLIVSFISLLLLCACKGKQTKEIKTVEWLIGTWENKTSKGIIYETWNKKNNKELSGKSYIIKKEDTIILETIKIIIEQDKWFYIPTVKNQNNDLPIRFTNKTISKNKLTFVNPEHDFPQMISYKKMTPDSLVAEISGIKNGKNIRRNFSMKLVK